jgi:hypothetical protein
MEEWKGEGILESEWKPVIRVIVVSMQSACSARQSYVYYQSFLYTVELLTGSPPQEHKLEKQECRASR